ncbi:MAG TPA: DNA-deoxyinosine glycosylase [Gammaproteobacteria bacterium]|nr:DNA-deoxyinosine glycosylase [Gammaproteobacteria bacterium]
MSPPLRGLPPIENPSARVLVLGSMPGAASLAAGQYYAHPRNLFWPLMGELLGFDPALPYAQRVAALKRARIALWDVIGFCRRTGSLDARIARDSVVVNDFTGFLARHRALRLICFNGTTAAASWRRHVQAAVAERAPRCVTLPSSSPANASIALAAKRTAWRVVREAAADERGAACS